MLLCSSFKVGQCFFFLCSRNLLSVLPKYLFNLPLKVLLVSNNKLVSIPEEIGKAKDLMELVRNVYASVSMNLYTVCSTASMIYFPTLYFFLQDVSCNEIQVLPAQVGRLHALRELNIRKNCLHMLPEGWFTADSARFLANTSFLSQPKFKALHVCFVLAVMLVQSKSP